MEIAGEVCSRRAVWPRAATGRRPLTRSALGVVAAVVAALAWSLHAEEGTSAPASSSPAAGTTTAGRAALPRNLPTMPAVEAAAVEKLIAQLAAPQYAARRAAGAALAEWADLPVAQEVFQRRLGEERDPAVRTVLEELLSPRSRPVVGLWIGGTMASKRTREMLPGAPDVFIDGQGRFWFDAAGPLFVGDQVPEQMDYRQGVLSPELLWQLKKVLADSGLLKAAPALAGRGEALTVRLFARAGGQEWTGHRGCAPAEMKAALPRLADDSSGAVLATLRAVMRAVPSEPFAGPWALKAQWEGRADGGVPEWPVASVSLQDGQTHMGTRELSAKELEEVRGALSAASRFMVPQVNKMVARVRLVPLLSAAAAVHQP